MDGIWKEFLNIAKQEAGSQMVETWLRAVKLMQWDVHEQTVLLETPNSFVKDWLEQHYVPFFEQHLARLFNVDSITIVFISPHTPSSVRITPAVVAHESQNDSSKSQHTNTQTRLFDGFIPAQVIKGGPVKREIDHKAPQSGHTTGIIQRPYSQMPAVVGQRNPGLNSAFTFDTFVVGPNNELAHAAATAVTESHKGYNPLFIYAPSGLGKTHLLHAIGNVLIASHSKQQQGPRVLYQTAERFVQDYINSIRFEKIHQFQLKYKDVDVLLIDDVQFLSNKEQTQEAFFHIFNALFDAHKQLVFTSDTYPHKLSGIADRLRSRFESGLIVDIQAPPLETKIAILKKKAEQNNVLLPDDVAFFLAMRNTGNVRTLEGSLIQVMAVASLTKQPVNLDAAKRALMRYGQEKIANAVNFERIVKGVCEHYSYTLGDLRSESKTKELALARQVAMYLMKKLTSKSLQEIGYFLGRKDHSTVLHGLNKIKNWIASSPDFSAQIMSLEAKILS